MAGCDSGMVKGWLVPGTTVWYATQLEKRIFRARLNFFCEAGFVQKYTKKRETDLHSFPRSECQNEKQIRIMVTYLDELKKTSCFGIIFTWFQYTAPVWD